MYKQETTQNFLAAFDIWTGCAENLCGTMSAKPNTEGTKRQDIFVTHPS
jgi:hypothetical protein